MEGFLVDVLLYMYMISCWRLKDCAFLSFWNGPTNDLNLASHGNMHVWYIVNTYSGILSVPTRLVIGSSSQTFSQVSIQEALKRTWTLKRTDLSTLIEVLTMASWMEASRNRVKLYACSTLRWSKISIFLDKTMEENGACSVSIHFHVRFAEEIMV